MVKESSMVTIKELLDFRDNTRNLSLLTDIYSENKKAGDMDIVPFIGAGLSAFCYPVWYFVLKHLNGLFGAEIKDSIQSELDEGKYEKVADMIAERNEESFYNELREMYGIKPLLPFLISIHKQAIGSLPFLFPSNLVLTSNFDGVIGATYDSVMHLMPSFEIVTEDIFNNPNLLNEVNNKGILFKIHGDVFSSNQNIVFSGASYARHYGKQTSLYKNLSTLFSRKSILFLGSSIRQDRFLDILKEVNNGQKHFAIIECDWGNETMQAQRESELLSLGIAPIFYPTGEHECVRILLAYLLKNKSNWNYTRQVWYFIL